MCLQYHQVAPLTPFSSLALKAQVLSLGVGTCVVGEARITLEQKGHREAQPHMVLVSLGLACTHYPPVNKA